MDRPIVVNSLLCFIHNFRSLPNLDVLTRSYFSDCVCDVARQTLVDLVGETKEVEENGTSSDSHSDPGQTLLELFDQVSAADPAPVFVAADLTTLPLVVIGDQNQSKSVFDEIHQLRFLIQNFLGAPDQISAIKRLPSYQFASLSSGDKIERESPVNLSTTSRHSSSPVRTVTPQANGFSDHAEGVSQSTSPTSSTTATPKKCHPRKHAPYKLDKAVRKLTDRLEAREGSKDQAGSPVAGTPNGSVCNESFGESTSNANENGRSREVEPATTPLGASLFLNSGLLNPTATPALDPIALMMLNKFANSSMANNSKSRSKSFRTQDSLSVAADDLDEEDKMSNESSPTPSDSSNGKEYKFEKEGDKPYTCEQPNCNKRFANKFLLKKHQFIHTGLRPHTCPFCAKRFNRKDNLLRHKKTHIQNASLVADGRRRPHHALLAPADLNLAHFDSLSSFIPISQSQNNDDDENKYQGLSP